MLAFQNHLERFEKYNVQVLGVSSDSLESHEKFAARLKLEFPLVVDEDGDIQDEYDTETDLVEPQKDGSLLVDARANVEELEEYFEIEIPRDKFDTVGGYLFHLMGTVPAPGEKITDNGLVLLVVDSDERRISKARVWREAEPEISAGEE